MGRETLRYPRNHVSIEDYKKNYCWRILFNSLWIYYNHFSENKIKSKLKSPKGRCSCFMYQNALGSMHIRTYQPLCLQKWLSWNFLSQQSLLSPDPSSQELLFLFWNRNSCTSYLPVHFLAHCWKNQRTPEQKNRQPDMWRFQNGDCADDRHGNSQGVPVTKMAREADRTASDSGI